MKYFRLFLKKKGHCGVKFYEVVPRRRAPVTIWLNRNTRNKTPYTDTKEVMCIETKTESIGRNDVRNVTIHLAKMISDTSVTIVEIHLSLAGGV